MSEKTFEEVLAADDINEATIALLTEEGYDDVSQLAGLDLKDFRDFGVKGRMAQILAEKYGKRSCDQTPDASGVPVTPVEPIAVKVEMPKATEQMSTRELLERLEAEPDDAEAMAVLVQKNEVAAAAVKTDAWSIPDDDGGLDVPATMAYIRYLGKKQSRPQRTYKRMRPKNINEVLGVTEKTLVNPFVSGQALVEGLDELGNDWSGVDRELMRAILWARATGHGFFPTSIDSLTAFEEINTDPRPRRWQVIFDDFSVAVADEDPSALGISLVWKEDATPSVDSLFSAGQGTGRINF